MPKTAAVPAVPAIAPPPPAGPVRLELLPLDRIAESPTNHRSRSWGDMEGLTASVREKGVVEPVLVRPMKGIGENMFMLVFGARRYRASKAAGLATIPAMIRDLSDFEVIELQVIENLQRADVHPLEEAEGYEQLLAAKEHEYSVDEIAAKVGKSKAYVYGRLKLLALGKEAREAFYQDEISASVALLLARIPVPELQLKALGEVREGDELGDYPGPMSYRDAQDHIIAKYTLRLADTPFDRGDADLVPSAGVCTTCPKRSGAQPELFADVKSPDLCTDPTCFAAKKDAAWKQQQEKAKEKGLKVLTAKETAKVFSKYNSDGHTSNGSPYVKLTDPCHDDPKHRTWKQILGKEAPEKVLARDQRGKVHELVDRDAALDAAKKAGVPVRKPVEPPTYDRAKHELEEKLRREVQRRIAAAVVERFEKVEPDAKLWRIIAEALARGYDTDHALERRFGEAHDRKAVDAAIAKMSESELRGFVLELALVPALYFGPYADRDEGSKPLFAWAKVDVKAIEKEAREAVKAQEAAERDGPTRWTAMGGHAVPKWVAEIVGDLTAVQIIQKWGVGATFEKGKPTPPPAAVPTLPKKKGGRR
jgi:ParB/RepB/Spo0J family partition protein